MKAEEMMHLITVRNQIFNNVEGAVLEMHEWDKEQFIDILREMEIEHGDIEDYANEEQSNVYRFSEKFISRFKELMEEKL